MLTKHQLHTEHCDGRWGAFKRRMKEASISRMLLFIWREKLKWSSPMTTLRLMDHVELSKRRTQPRHYYEEIWNISHQWTNCILNKFHIWKFKDKYNLWPLPTATKAIYFIFCKCKSHWTLSLRKTQKVSRIKMHLCVVVFHKYIWPLSSWNYKMLSIRMA